MFLENVFKNGDIIWFRVSDTEVNSVFCPKSQFLRFCENEIKKQVLYGYHSTSGTRYLAITKR